MYTITNSTNHELQSNTFCTVLSLFTLPFFLRCREYEMNRHFYLSVYNAQSMYTITNPTNHQLQSNTFCTVLSLLFCSSFSFLKEEKEKGL